MGSNIVRYSATVSLLAAGYFAAARLGLGFAIPPGNATPVWLNSGLALAALLLLGTRVWPGVWLGAILANALTAVSLVTATALATGNTLEALLGVWLFRHVLRVEDRFQRVEDAFLFAALAAVTSAVAALVGAGSLVLGGSMAWSQFAANAGTWWLGDVTGLMIVCPLLLALQQPRRQPLLLCQKLELAILFALVVVASQGIFGGWLSEPLGNHLLYVPLVFLIWVALRFELREVALATGLFSGAAVWGTSRGVGPYHADALQQALVNLQIFVNVYALTGLALAAVVARRRNAETRLRRAYDELEQRVRERTADLDRANQDLRSEVTDRQRAERALQERETRYRELIEHLHVGVVVHAPDTSIVLCNHRAAELLGLPDSQLPGKADNDPAWSFVREDGTTLPVEDYPVNRVLASGQPLTDLTCGINHPHAADRVWVLVNAFPEFGGNRAERNVVVTFLDITDRKRLHELEHLRLATALESIGEGILITDSQGTIQYVNPAFERITGYPRLEVLGKNPRLLQSGQHEQTFYRAMWETIAAGKIWRGSFVDKRKDGQLYDVETTIAPITEPSGNQVGYTAISRDVTDRTQAERALRESAARIRAIVETATDVIITIDEQGRIETCNPAIERIFGYAREQLIGQNVRLLMPSPYREAHDGYLAKYLQTGKSVIIGKGLEVIGRRQDGSLFPMDLAVNETRLGDRRFFTGIIRDVTQRHLQVQAEKELAATHEQLRVARTIQQQFFPTAAPDLPGFEMGGASYPAEATGGDYFDYFPLSDGRVGVVLADVSGHGLGPALVMSQTRAYLRALLTLGLNVSELVTRLNDFLIEDCPEDSFVTLFLAQIDPRDQSLVYASAGHQCYLLGPADEVELLESTGTPLGARPGGVPQAEPRKLQPGQLVLFLTDGVPETAGLAEDYFGMERALAIVRANRDKPAREIVEELYLAARRFAQGQTQQDDITAVVVKVVGPFPEGRLQGAGGDLNGRWC